MNFSKCPRRTDSTGTVAQPSEQVVTLDPWIQGVSRPSRRIRELHRRRRSRHDALAAELRADLDQLDREVARTVAVLSSSIQAELDKASHMVRLKREEVEALAAAPQKLAMDSAWEAVCQLTEQRRRAIDAFYDLLLEVEEGRCNSTKATVARYSERMARNGHLPQPQLQAYIAGETKGLSEAHLRNIISYGDLRFCLSRQADRDFLKFREKVLAVRRLCKEKCQREALTRLQEAANRSTDECITCTAQGRRAARHFQQRVERLQAQLEWPQPQAQPQAQPFPFHPGSVAAWEAGVRSCAQRLEQEATNVVSAIREGLAQQEQLCVLEVTHLKNALLTNDLCSFNEHEKMNARVCQPILDHLKSRQRNDPEDFLKSWKIALKQFQSEVESLAGLLREASKLCDHHRQCLESERKQIFQHMEEKTSSRTGNIEAKERRLVTIITRGMQETEHQALEDIMLRINTIIDEINNSYQTSYNEGKEMIQSYALTMHDKQQVLENEARNFLKSHPKPIEQVVMENIPHCLGDFGKTILQLNSEKRRLWIEIENFFNRRYSNELACDGKRWMEETIEIITKEQKNKEDACKVQKDTLQLQVQKTRLTELEEHNKLLKNRSEAINQATENFQNELVKIYHAEFNVFNELSLNLKKLTEDGLHLMDWMRVREITHKASEMLSLSENNINNLEAEFEAHIQCELNRIHIGNIEFMSSLKKVSEGGNFAESEVTNILAQLEMLEKNMTLKGEQHFRTLTQKSKQCCKQARKYHEKCLTDLQQHLEDLMFMRDVTDLVQNAQAHIKTQTMALKNGGMMLLQQIQEIKSQHYLIDKVNDLPEHWRCTLESLVRRHELLLGISKSNHLMSDTTPLSPWGLILNNKQGNVFLQNISLLLKGSLSNVEKRTMEFYNKKVEHGTLKSDQLLEHTNSFMLNMGKKYRYYQVQCIDVWVSELKEYLDMIFHLKEHAKKLSSMTVNEHYKTFVHELNERDTMLGIQIDQLRAYYRNHQMNLIEKLGPLHGFSDNQQILDSLCSEFDGSFQTLSQKIEETISAYTKRLHQHLDDYKERLKRKLNIIQKILKELCQNQLSTSLAQALISESKNLSYLSSLQLESRTQIFYHIDKTETDDAQYKEFWQNKDAAISQKFTEYANMLADAASKITTTLKEKDTRLSDVSEMSSIIEAMEHNFKHVEALAKTRETEIKELQARHQGTDLELQNKWMSSLQSVKRLHLQL